jgi:hypothetical protein
MDEAGRRDAARFEAPQTRHPAIGAFPRKEAEARSVAGEGAAEDLVEHDDRIGSPTSTTAVRAGRLPTDARPISAGLPTSTARPTRTVAPRAAH